MQTISFNPKNVEFKDLKGKRVIVEDICESLGNLMYMGVSDIGFKRIAENIYDGKDIELNKEQLLTIKSVIDASVFFMFIKVDLGVYIDQLIHSLDINNTEDNINPK